MASCGLWPPVDYGFLWLMASCGLWLPVAYGSMWLMASCGLWPPVAYGPCGLWSLVAYGLLWLMAPCGLWPPVAYGFLWLMASCGLWPPVTYFFLCNLLHHYMVARWTNGWVNFAPLCEILDTPLTWIHCDWVVRGQTVNWDDQGFNQIATKSCCSVLSGVRGHKYHTQDQFNVSIWAFV